MGSQWWDRLGGPFPCDAHPDERDRERVRCLRLEEELLHGRCAGLAGRYHAPHPQGLGQVEITQQPPRIWLIHPVKDGLPIHLHALGYRLQIGYQYQWEQIS